jgi:hypothetical protein
VITTLHDRRNGRSGALLVMPTPDDAVRLVRTPTGMRAGTVERALEAVSISCSTSKPQAPRVGPAIAIYPVPGHRRQAWTHSLRDTSADGSIWPRAGSGARC